MVKGEEQSLLDLSRRERCSSAVSQALQALQADLWCGREMWPLKVEGSAADYRILVASDRATRERAYALAHRVYRRAGYVAARATGFCVSPYDKLAQTLTLLAVDTAGSDCATISLVFDASAPGGGLPCDEIYRDEVEALRSQGRRLAEVTRLAIIETCSGAKDLLLHLFNQCYIFARVVHGQSDLLVEVNPRHVSYYQRLLHFQVAGTERPCSRVQGAPALLMRLKFSEIEAILARSMGDRDGSGRRRHSYPYSLEEEAALARFLARNHRPMSAEEAQHIEELLRAQQMVPASTGA